MNNLILLHSVEKILLVGKHKEGDTRKSLLLEQLLQLCTCLINPPTVGAIDYVHQCVSLVEIVAPVGTDRLLACTQTTTTGNQFLLNAVLLSPKAQHDNVTKGAAR